MRTLVVDHPLVTHKLTVLRDESTQAPTFRRLTDELVTLLAYEATREVPVQQVNVRTPVGEAEGFKMARPVPLVVPVLRAGIGMLDGMTRLLPTADVGFVGMVRDEESLVASTYAPLLPPAGPPPPCLRIRGPGPMAVNGEGPLRVSWPTLAVWMARRPTPTSAM